MRSLLEGPVRLPPGAREALEGALDRVRRDPGLTAVWKDTLALLERASDLGREDPLGPLPDLGPGRPLGGLLDAAAFVAVADRTAGHLAARGVPPEVASDTFDDLALWMEKYRNLHGVWGTGEQGWLAALFTGRILRVGRLQFQPVGEFWGREGPLLNVHIPEGAPLEPGAVRDSLGRASRELPRWFPGLAFRGFVCRSWLLDPQLARILPPEANLVRFQQEFRLFSVGGDDRQLRERVFGDPDADPRRAEVRTSLQRAVAAAWARGEQFAETGGWRELEAAE